MPKTEPIKVTNDSKKNITNLDETLQLLAQRNAELAVISSVQEGLAAEMDMQEIYDLVGDQIRKMFDAQVASVVTFNFENQTEEFQYIFEDGERFNMEPRPIDKVRQRIIDTQDVLCINENADDVWTEITGEAPTVIPGTKLTKSALYVPMKVGNDVRGYVSLQNLDREHAFSDSDIQLLTTLTNSMSVALENARLFNEAEQRNAELAIINSVGEAMSKELDVTTVTKIVGDKVRDIFCAEITEILLLDHENNMIESPYSFYNGYQTFEPFKLGEGLTSKIIHSRKPLLLHTIDEQINNGAIVQSEEDKSESYMGVPILFGEKVLGVVSVQSYTAGKFDESNVSLLSTLSSNMGIALQNARLFEETTRLLTETEQRSAELAVINSVQQGLVAEMDMQGIYDLVGDKTRELFDSQVTVIATFDHESHKELFNYVFEDGKRFYPEARVYDNIRGQLIRTRQLISINENASEGLKKFGVNMEPAPGTKSPKSMVYVPLIVGDTVRGYVSLQNLDRENAFSDADIRLLSTLANSMSVALENARLFNEAEQRNAELAVINSVQQGLVAEMDMQGIYDLVGNKTRELFDAQVTVIASFDHENQKEVFNYAFEDGRRIQPKPRPLDKIRERLIKTKKLIDIRENSEEAYTTITGKSPESVPGTTFAKSMIYVPLVVGDSVRGYVSLQNLDREHAFSDADIRLLSTLANSMSVALENARLFNEAEQRNAELAVINSVQQGLVAEMDMQGIYDLVGDRVRDLFDAQVTGIVIFDHNNKTEEFRYLFEDGDRLFPSARPYDKVRIKIIEDRKTLLINENASVVLSEILGETHKPVPGTRAAKSAVYVPMVVGETVFGYVTLQNLDKENAYSDSDVSLLETLVNSMTVALENARLFSETTRLLAETEQRNAELAVINSVQEGLVREMDMESIYSLVGKVICDVLNTQTLIIRTFDHEKRIENWEFAIENGERMYVESRPLIWANKHIIKTKEPLLINKNYVETAKEYGDTRGGVTKGLPPKSAIFVPMMLGGKVIGSVSLQNVLEENAFTESDVRLLNTLTNSMSVALENARLFNETTRLLAETEQRATEMQTVNNISRALVSQLEFDTLMNLVGEQMRETFKADIVYLAIHDTKSNMLHFPYYYGDEAKSKPFGNGITEKIILSKEPILINHDLDEVYDKIKADKIGKIVESYLGVPIISGDKSIGVISVQSTELENRFTDNDLRLLNTIAANLGVAMQNAEAYQKLQDALNDLRATQQQLIQSEKMASLGELTAGIAHEIQNPLNFVNNFSEVSKELLEEMMEELKKGDTLEVETIAKDIIENLEKIAHHGKRADGIVKGMLQHSRTSTGIKEPTDINMLADEYLRLAYHGLRAKDKSFNATMKTDFDKGVGKIDVISQDIGRVILNLITNAFYAVTEKKKLLKINGSEEGYEPTVSVSTKKNGSYIELSVEDNGNGIPKTIIDKIFQPFFTTKPTGQGTGLGLSLSYDIIQAHGGELKVKTENEKGTVFNILLPLNGKTK